MSCPDILRIDFLLHSHHCPQSCCMRLKFQSITDVCASGSERWQCQVCTTCALGGEAMDLQLPFTRSATIALLKICPNDRCTLILLSSCKTDSHLQPSSLTVTPHIWSKQSHAKRGLVMSEALHRQHPVVTKRFDCSGQGDLIFEASSSSLSG